MPLSESISVMVVDDEALVRSGIALLLHAERDIQVVAEAQSGQQALDLFATHQPQVVLMDVRMPNEDGVETTRQLMARSIDVLDAPPAVLMLTTFDDGEAVIEAIRHGASGFMLKSAAPKDLLTAVRSVAAGGTWLDPLVTRHLFEALSQLPRFSSPAPQLK
jgi:DNA-binding NarL/FixJ family response regulator